MTKMAVITKRDGSRELQWLAAWGATRAAKKNEGDAAVTVDDGTTESTWVFDVHIRDSAHLAI